MKNRPFHHLGVILLTWVLMPVLWLHGEQRQNVLFIAVDDLRPGTCLLWRQDDHAAH